MVWPHNKNQAGSLYRLWKNRHRCTLYNRQAYKAGSGHYGGATIARGSGGQTVFGRSRRNTAVTNPSCTDVAACAVMHGVLFRECGDWAEAVAFACNLPYYCIIVAK